MLSRVILWTTALLVPLAFQGCSKGTHETQHDTEYPEPVVIEGVEADSKVAEPTEELVDEQSSLTIGDIAPPLAIEKWVKGTAVDGFDSNKRYVVEFWATWCGPCRTSMPHLSELQQQHPDDIVIVGISGEDEATITGFMESEHDAEQTWDDVIQYTIAMDRDDTTSKAYMLAAKERGIPTAFVVGQDGKIDWIGHPADLDSVLPKLAAGDWDRELARSERETAKERQAEAEEVMKVVMLARADKDYDGAIAALDKMLEKYPGNSSFLNPRFRILLEAERFDDATQMVTSIDATNPENLYVLNAITWAATSTAHTPLLEASLQSIQQAYDASESEDAGTIDTIARLHYKLGNLDQAIEFQEKAVALESDPSLKRTLEEYRDALAGESSDDAAAEEEESVTVTSTTAATDEPDSSE